MNSHTNFTRLDERILSYSFDEVSADEFYRDIFGDDELAYAGELETGKYCGIAIEVTNQKRADGSIIVRRHHVTDDLGAVDLLQFSNHFCLMAPISYAGKSRKSKNARFLYAMCIEVDGLRKTKDNIFQGLDDLFFQIENGHLPKPTYIVSSGTGLHIYYVFEKPIPLFQNVARSLERYKRHLTKKIWNRYVTDLYKEEDIQYESLFQGFRVVGTLTKYGLATHDRTEVRTSANYEDIVRAYKYGDGEKVTIEYMNEFATRKDCLMEVVYKSNLTLTKAKELYPDWYERRIVNKEGPGRWYCDRAVYDWWKNRILNEGRVGHRYYCLMMLAIYAIKCGEEKVSYEELEQDCFEIMEYFDTLTNDPKNRFTEEDVYDALQTYEDEGFVTYPINSIANRSGIPIEKNKRNGLKQKEHLEIARAVRDVKIKQKGKTVWYEGNGRPKGSGTKQQEIQEWRKNNPNGKKAACIKELGLTKPTVYKWWDVPLEEPEQILDLTKPQLEDNLDELMSRR